MKPIRTSTRLSIALVLMAGLAPAAAHASGSPASPVPANRWGTLEPVQIIGDFTSFVGQSDPKAGNTLQWYDVDIENDFLYTTTGQGLQIFSLADPASPTNLSYIYGWISGSAFPVWNYSDKDWYIKDLDVPQGNDALVAVGMEEQGFAVVNAASKSNPVVAYQAALDTSWVHAARVAGKDYAWAVERSGGKIDLYDMTKAATYSMCHEAPPQISCSGVFKGAQAGLGTGWSSIDGTGNFLVLGRGGRTGFSRIYNVADPTAPVQVMEVAAPATAVGMWKIGNSAMYLATMDLSGKTMSIYDASCALSASCPASPSPIATRTVTAPQPLSHLTVSLDGGGAYIYLGGEDLSSCVAQREYLFDLSTPSSPEELTPQTNALGYWGWYYMSCDTGFNLVGPRAAEVHQGYIYRAANSILDVHRIATAVPPSADFSWSPALVYPGTPVNFTDQSSGSPTSYSWSFAGGSPASSTASNPSGVTFAAAGPHDVTLVVSSDAGQSPPKTRTVTVLDPSPVIGSVTASPLTGYQCTPFTFTANNVGGQVPVSLGWELRDSGNGLVTTGGNNATFGWTTTQATAPGIYTATATASNIAGFTTKSASVTVNALPGLPGDGTWSPGNDSFTAGVVNFHANAVGATEWSWDFGDSGGVFTAFSSDPINGPNPTHSYNAIGDYTVRVKVRNCAQPERTSAGLAVHISQITPLTASFDLASPDLECAFLGTCTYPALVAIGFVDHSTGVEFYDYDWDGNGTFEDANHASPVLQHTYASSISTPFKPKLRVRRGASESVEGSLPYFLKIGVSVPPSITVSGPTGGLVNQTYAYSASATNCTPATNGWSWTTSGGTGSSTSNSIQVSWTTIGGKTVSATNSACGAASGSRSVSISGSGGGGTGGGGGAGPGGGGSALTVNFTYTPAAPKVGDLVTFVSTSTGSPTSTFWTWGDGTENGNGTTATHTFTKAGNFAVGAHASKAGSGTGCEFGICSADSVKTVVVATGGPPPPVAAFTVSGGGSCISELGFEICSATTGQDVVYTDASTGTVDTRTWNFGDGGTGSGTPVSHAFPAPGTYQVSLTAQGAGASSTATKTFTVTGPAVSKDALVLTWFQRSRGALEQTSDFFVYNPGDEALDLSVTYLKRGTPNPTPPHADLVVAPHATLVKADALKTLFNLDDGSGFLYFTWEGVTNPYPVITGTNNTKLADGTTFGQSFAAVKVARQTPAAADTEVLSQDLVGLSDISGESFSTFGISNPFDAPANIQLEFSNGAGAPLRPALPVTIARNGQILYQIVDIRALGVQNQDNYRLTVKSVSGGPVIPFAKKLREGSQDQAYVPAIKTHRAKVLLLGAYSGTTVLGNKWSTDAVLFNPTAAEMVVEARFIPVGVDSTPSALATFHLQPKETRRLVDMLKTEWNAQNINGYISFETKNAGDGPYAGILGEIYDYSKSTKIYGNVYGAMSEDDAGEPGQGLALVGLSQNAAYTSTLWLYNPGPGPAQVEVIYRASSDGRELARALTGSPEGVMRLVNAKAFPAAVQGLNESFTIEVHINFGRMMASATMVSNATKDPTYVVGVAH